MLQSSFIRKFIASFLLLLFLVSAAPKAWFHDALAGHKDQPVSCKHKDRSASCVHESHMNCHFDQLVVSSFFELADPVFFYQPSEITASIYESCAEDPITGRPGHSDSRGPPSC